MREPDLTGTAGRAWRVRLPRTERSDKACLESWIVNRPGAHPFWEYWLVSVVHLRDIPGVDPANKAYPEAEYEFMIYAINPNKCPTPDPDKPEGGYPYLTPLDVVEQFHGVSDADAGRICNLATRAIIDGKLSPDQDYRSTWKEVIATTVKHFTEGKHTEN